MKLQDKVCIVTGAASGIGLAKARLLAGESAVVVLADARRAAPGEAAAALRTARTSPADKDHAR